jgi:hypothetical protein
MRRSVLLHGPAMVLFAVLTVVWTWPLALHFSDHIPGLPGDNFSFLWNLWWMRKALGSADLEFFRSTYLFSPFGVDLVNHPHTALQGYLSATVLARWSVIEAENLYIFVSVLLNALGAYALVFDVLRDRRAAILAGIAFGGSPYIAAHLLGHFDLLTAWVLPVFALFMRRALEGGRIVPAVACGVCVAVAAYCAYYHVVYLVLFALAYTLAAWRAIRFWRELRAQRQALFTLRLIVIALLALDLFLIVMIATTGGFAFALGGVQMSARSVQNPLLLAWLLGAGWLLTRWRLRVCVQRPAAEVFWRGIQALMVTAAVFAVLSLPLIAHAFGLMSSGRYVSQVYFWRSAPRGLDVLAPLLGNPFHPLYGPVTTRLYDSLGLDRIEAVAWLGIVPLVVLLAGRGRWGNGEEARRWKVVLAVFAVWALGPFLTDGGVDLGLPLPETLARFVPLVENARMPGRAIVVVYLALGVLMALRLAGQRTTWTGIATLLLAFDYLNAPVPLTALDRPPVYERLAAIKDEGAVIDVPFGIGDGLTVGRGSQERRLLYHATIHGHPVVGGYIGRMPPGVAQAYESMPVVGNLLRLSGGEEPIADDQAAALPFRYLVLDTATASNDLRDYVHSALDMDLLMSEGGRELYAVQGMKPSTLRASTRGAIVLSSVVR